jgi:hypothetical protein
VVKVDVKIESAGTAWLGGRTQLTPTGVDLYQYRLEVTQDDDGARSVAASKRGKEGPTVLWEGPEPDAQTWTELMLIAQGARIAFYVNGRAVHVETAASLDEMGQGSIAIGVDAQTTAAFDELAIRSLHDLAPYMPD